MIDECGVSGAGRRALGKVQETTNVPRPAAPGQFKTWIHATNRMKVRLFPMNRPDSIPTRDSLLSRLKDWDDNESWRDFFNTYWRLIYNTAIRLGLNDAEAQEVVQETVVAVARKINSFKYDPATARFKTWLNTIIRRRVIDHRRKQSRQPDVVSMNAAPDDGMALEDELADPASLEPDPKWEEDWRMNLIEAALEKVKRQTSPKQFLMYDQYVIQGKSLKEVARDLGASAAAIYIAKHRVGKLVQAEARRLEEKFL